MRFFSFDTESDGLYGEAFAIAALVLEEHGEIVESFVGKCLLPPVQDAWTIQNCLPFLADIPEYSTRRELRDSFWAFYERYADQCTVLADVPYPVEVGLLLKCMADDEKRKALSPFPVIDVASLFFANHLDPLTNRMEFARLKENAHHPMNDALASALCAIRLLNAERRDEEG